MNGAVLAIGAGPDLLDRRDQPRRTVGDDEPGCGEPTADQIAAELEPVLLGLPRLGLGGRLHSDEQSHLEPLPVTVNVREPGIAEVPKLGLDVQQTVGRVLIFERLADRCVEGDVEALGW